MDTAGAVGTAGQRPSRAPRTVAAYLAYGVEDGCRPSTLGRRLAAIRYAHKLANHPTPTDSEAVKATLRGIRRTFGGAKVRKAPAIAAKLQAMVALAPDRLAGLRDRALLLLGFAGAFRRSNWSPLMSPTSRKFRLACW